MTQITAPEEIERALFKYHLTLAAAILNKIKNKSPQKIVELGSGPGTFTLPFIKVLNNNFKIFHCIDPYLGPYKGDRQVFESKLIEKKIKDKVEITECDAREIDKLFSDIDLIIGHEMLSDLNSKQVSQVLATSLKALKPGGIFIHAEFSPIAITRGEELLHIFNDFSQDSASNTDWFSPTADELAALAQKNGFRTLSVDYIKIPLQFKKQAATEMLKKWKIGSKYFEKYQSEIDNVGFEFPMEQILYCTK